MASAQVPEYIWSTENTKILISLYEEQPCLWDTNLKQYHNKHLREKAMTKIGEELGTSIKQVRAKFHKMRTYYRSEANKVQKSVKSGTEADDVYKSKWQFFDILDTFLAPQTIHRATKSNLETASQSDVSSEPGSEQEDESFGSESSAQAKQPRSQVMTLKRKQSDSVMDEAAKALKVLSSHPPRTPIHEDAEESFSRHIAHQLRLITDNQTKLFVMTRMQSILYEAQYPATNQQNQQCFTPMYNPKKSQSFSNTPVRTSTPSKVSASGQPKGN